MLKHRRYLMQARFTFSFLSAAHFSLSAEDSRVFWSIQQLHKPAWQLSSSRFRGARETAQLLVPKRISRITLNILTIPLAWYWLLLNPFTLPFPSCSPPREAVQKLLTHKDKSGLEGQTPYFPRVTQEHTDHSLKDTELDLRDFKPNQSKKRSLQRCFATFHSVKRQRRRTPESW